MGEFHENGHNAKKYAHIPPEGQRPSDCPLRTSDQRERIIPRMGHSLTQCFFSLITGISCRVTKLVWR